MELFYARIIGVPVYAWSEARLVFDSKATIDAIESRQVRPKMASAWLQALVKKYCESLQMACRELEYV
jgi:hypothetical protein